jgi:TatA/E family protein of Tat protein translocase
MTGWGEWIVIASVALLVWKAHRLPELGSSVVKSFQAFKKALKSDPPVKEVKEWKEPASPEN